MSITHGEKLKTLVLMGIIALACTSIAGCGPSEDTKTEELKAKVLERLSDPDSAQFRRLKLLRDNKGLCGEVNAKNRMGGYGGFAAFAIDQGGKVVILRETTLDAILENDEQVKKRVVLMIIAGNRSQAETLIMDGIEKKEFQYWSECAK